MTDKNKPISPNRLEVAKRINRLMKQDFPSQADFGAFLGINQPTVSKIVRGLNNLSHEHMIKLVKEKKWNPKYLTSGVGSTHLTKEDTKRNLLTDISELTLDVNLLGSRLQKLEDENMYLLRIIRELKDEIQALRDEK